MTRPTQNVEYQIDRSFTVAELMEVLSGMDSEAKVVLTSDYGDLGNTQQMLPITDIEEASKNRFHETCYSASGVALSSDDEVENDDDYEDVVVLSSL